MPEMSEAKSSLTELSPQTLIPGWVMCTVQSIENMMGKGTIGEELNGQSGQEQQLLTDLHYIKQVSLVL